MHFAIIFLFGLLIAPSWAGVPAVSSGGDACHCPVIPDLTALECILDFVSHVEILDKTTKTVNGTTFNEYTLKHIKIYKGGVSLPTVVLVPQGPCGLELEVNLEYLLCGVVTGDTNLYASLCLQILQVLSPLWSLVDAECLHELSLLNTVTNLVCLLLKAIIELLFGNLIPCLPGIDCLGGLTGPF
ncbi:unnamed protein product, partial [Mesorhabditis belari]|uniref:Uncharacterized protein n=1 Tax=Mesorhabditis belari TaxID=2138241 RepID=A0AAF3J6J6_9BILA